MRSADGGAGFGGPADFGALAQQYWNAVSEAVRSAGGATKPQDPWQATMDAWSQLAGGRQRNDASDAVERFSAQARQWLSMMQQVAGQFAGQSASAQEIAGAWKEAMGAGANPFASLFSEMTGRGQSGFDQWYQQVAPMLNGMLGGGMLGGGMRDGGMFAGLRQQGISALHTPAFGLHREHQERWQALAEAQLELQQANDAYNALMLEAGRDAFERFERKLAERSEPGRQLQSARALFDLWIDAAEEAYAEIALSAGFRKAYGALVNAQMRMRAGIQREIELIGNLLGMPGRTEVDAAHRRIADLERQIRRLRDGAPTHVERAKPASDKPAKTRSVSPPAERVANARPAAKKKSAAKKPKPLRAVVASAVERAQRPAIAAIAMPEPLKSLLSKRKPTAKTAKRTR
jgi:polyhydroxyalkanoate synthase subunit PhaE